MIIFSNVCKTFNDATKFSIVDLNLTINDGEILVLLGTSGSGKTTLLKMLNRLIEPTSGAITLDGIDLSSINPVTLRRQMGYVFQGTGLFPHLTVLENITIVLRLAKWPLHKRRQRAVALLELVNLNPVEFSDRYPDQLSGGQQQRVGVARALATDPNYLLMDEPFGALDAINRDALQTELLKLQAELHKTIIFVTHDIHEAVRLADRIAVIHQGQLQQIGDKYEIVKSPATDYVRELFATFNLDEVFK